MDRAGPLDPFGSHGLAVDAHGNYVENGGVVRGVLTSHDATPLELVEQYDEATATSLAPNDTSFAVRGELTRGGSQTYDVKSSSEQFVTILVVPETRFDNYTLAVKSSDGATLAISKTYNYVEWIQLQAPRGARFDVEVTLTASSQPGAKNYRLYVVGSGPAFADTDIRGAHQRAL